MAYVSTITKQPWEVFFVESDFADRIDDGETISDIDSTVVAYNSANEDVSDDILDLTELAVDGTILKVPVTGGVDQQNYVLAFRAHISDTKKLENDHRLKVRD